MSTNPFRRSSLKGFNGSSGGGDGGDGHGQAIASVPIDIEAAAPLTVNTKVPTPGQKHVNFASPPAVPISPVYHPPSPESTRISPAIQNARPALPSPTDYTDALQSDPFRAGAETDEDDGAITQALENTKVNATLVAPRTEASREDAVRDTLSRFASTPRKPSNPVTDGSQPSQNSVSHRQTMDVDAFKRLLLTGDSGQALQKTETSGTAPILTGDNSSGTDTASLSQRSLFDQPPLADDSSQSSDDIDPVDAASTRRSLAPSETTEEKKRPPPPKPRYGKPVTDDPLPGATVDLATRPAHNQETTRPPVSLNTVKKPPAPPLTRRRSQNSSTAPLTSSRNSSSSEITFSTNLDDGSPKAPPPRRSRRPVSVAEHQSSTDLPPTEEEPDSAGSSRASSRKPSDTRPPPPPSRNSSKRVSMGALNPPPLPPPRRGRGSSRSSIDSQRPSMSAIVNSDTVERSSREFTRPETDSRKTSSSSNAHDILADLAALQREVDAARTRASK